MANATRMRVSNSSRVYHRVPAVGDMPTKDIATNDENVIGLGGQGDFEIKSDASVTYTDASKVQSAVEAAIGSSDAIGQFIYIKNTGYTTALKETATTSNLAVALGGVYASFGAFVLAPGESIVLHGLNSACADISLIYLDSSSGDIYTEVIYL